MSPKHDDRPDRLACYDTGQAVALLTVQATSMGLSVRQMEGFDRARAREAGQVPAPFEPLVVMAIGYSGDPESLVLEKHREAEVTPRQRRPIGEFVFDGDWGRALDSH
jgi:nitroreductase